MDDESAMEHQKEADRLEREAEKLAQESERVGGKVDAAREDWNAKESDVSVPGAQPDLRKVLEADEDEDQDEEEES